MSEHRDTTKGNQRQITQILILPWFWHQGCRCWSTLVHRSTSWSSPPQGSWSRIGEEEKGGEARQAALRTDFPHQEGPQQGHTRGLWCVSLQPCNDLECRQWPKVNSVLIISLLRNWDFFTRMRTGCHGCPAGQLPGGAAWSQKKHGMWTGGWDLAWWNWARVWFGGPLALAALATRFVTYCGANLVW